MMINIFNYTDFKKYLSDYYEATKAEKPNFSYQSLANKAGFQNKGFVYNIINGNKTLSKSNVFKLSQALGHNRFETEYFETLVTFNQAKDLNERNFYFDKLNHLQNKGKKKSEAQVLRQDQYEFYSKWYHVMIRSIIDMYEFSDDFKWLAKMVYPPISSKQAKQSVTLLEKLGLIEKQKNGIFKVTEKSLTTGNKVLSLAVQNFHVECTDLAKKALQKTPAKNRNITGLTLGISEQTYYHICEEIQQFQQNIMNLANSDEQADRVYQFNFHLFPTSDFDKERIAK